MSGGKSRTRAQANHQALTSAEEIALVRWITYITATEYPSLNYYLLLSIAIF